MSGKISGIWRSGIALLLALCLVVGFVPGAAFAVEVKDGNDDGVINYVSFGASNVNGFGVEGYIDMPGTIDDIIANPDLIADLNVFGFQRMPKESYPYMVAEALNAAAGGTVDSGMEASYDGDAKKDPFSKVDIDQMAISSMRMEELGFLLGTFEGDSYTDWRFYDIDGDGDGQNWFGKAYGGSLEALQAEYIRAIKEADVITMDMGMNNFGVYIGHQTGGTYEEVLEDIDPELAVQFVAAKEYVRDLAVQYSDEAVLLLDGMNTIIDALAYAVVGYCHNFDKVMAKIYELNPDVNVVVISIQNLLTDIYLEVPGFGNLPLGDIFGAVIDVANLHTATGSPYCDKYVYADIRKEGRVRDYVDDLLDYNGDPASLSQNMKDCFTLYDYDHMAFPLYTLAYTECCTKLAEMLLSLGEQTVGVMALAYGVDIEKLLQGDANAALALRASFLADKNFNAVSSFMASIGFGSLSADSQSAMEAVRTRYIAYETKVFDTMHDIMAEVMQAGVQDHTLTMDGISGSITPARNAIKKVVLGMAENGSLTNSGLIVEAFAELHSAEDFEAYEFTLPSDFCQTLAEAAGMEYEAMMDIFCMYVRTSIGNSFYSHPSPEGHRQIADTVLNALENDVTGDDVVIEELKSALENLLSVLDKYGPDAWEKLENDYKITDVNVVIDDDFKYVALGDGTAVAEGYAEEVKAYLEAKAAEEEKTVEFVNAAKVGNSVAAEIADLSPEVADADLITLGFSMTDMLSNALLTQEKPDWVALLGEEAVPYVEDALAAVAEKIAALDMPEMEDMLNAVVEAYAYNMVSYTLELPVLIRSIRAVNEDAAVVMIGMYNPFKGVTASISGKTLELSAFDAYVDYLISAVCVYGVGMELTTGEADYVDAREVEICKTELGMLDVMKLMGGDVSDLYPSEAGHAYIAEKITKALKVSFPTDEPVVPPVDEPDDEPEDILWGDANGDGVVLANDAQLVLQYSVSLIGEEDLNLAACDVNSDGKILANDAQLILQYSVSLITKFPVEG